MSRLPLAMALLGAMAGVAAAFVGGTSGGEQRVESSAVVQSASDRHVVSNTPSGSPEEHELIPVINDDGALAYVWADELAAASGGAVASPEEARRWMDHIADLRASGVTEILIPAYSADGTTVTGQFAIAIADPGGLSDISDDELKEVFADDPEILEELLAQKHASD
ncbi:hypothetical protein [Demequina sp.]|uniref:hypothetical protein n=1 Tax=Demequina sp. TaxID=2050685 RepID=UPI003D0C3ED4